MGGGVGGILKTCCNEPQHDCLLAAWRLCHYKICFSVQSLLLVAIKCKYSVPPFVRVVNALSEFTCTGLCVGYNGTLVLLAEQSMWYLCICPPQSLSGMFCGALNLITLGTKQCIDSDDVVGCVTLFVSKLVIVLLGTNVVPSVGEYIPIAVASSA